VRRQGAAPSTNFTSTGNSRCQILKKKKKKKERQKKKRKKRGLIDFEV
jgi:hypothetical protein